MRPHSWVRDQYIGPAAGAAAAATRSPGGFWPVDMQTAYGVNAAGLPALPNGLGGGGAGITIALVDSNDAPNALADLQYFSNQFGLPQMNSTSGTTCKPTFTKVSQTGGSTLPKYNSGWEVEISLDIQWAHAMAPCANILLVEASSSSGSDLDTALTYASAHAQVVSMSWGGSEFRGESTDDQVFFQKSGVVFVASAGDSGGVVEWPSISKEVVAVGGTNLPVASGGGLGTGAETAWSSSGGGCTSQQEPEPTVETVIKYPTKCTGRGVPDVAASGGANSAAAVYVSKQGGWLGVYGTSLAAPMWAGIIGSADGQRIKAGKAVLSSGTLADLYYAYTSSNGADFTDITSGTAGKNTAVAGWDFVTGLGSPKGKTLIPYLATAP
jgi:subtilase family serine protease